jgi:hypothetical protein
MPQGITDKTPDKVVQRYETTGDADMRRRRAEGSARNIKDAGTRPLTRDDAGLIDKPSKVTGQTRTTSPTSRQVESRLLTKAGKEAGLKVGTGLKSAKGRLPKDVATKIEATASKTAEKTVTTRDAGNAKVLRGRISARASTVTQPATQSTPAIRAKAELGKIAKGVGDAAANTIGNNPAVNMASAIAEADKATGFKRTQYSGSFGGPSFTKNPFAASNSKQSSPSMRSMLGMPKGKK